MENVTPVARSDIAPRFLQWSPIVLGAFAATALSSVLLTFAVTIGLGVTSAAPTWRDASAALAILSGLYLIIQAVVSFGLGGYIAGHTRTSTGPAAVEETEHVDGAHGLGSLGARRGHGRHPRRPDRRGNDQPDVVDARSCAGQRGRTAAEL